MIWFVSASSFLIGMLIQLGSVGGLNGESSLYGKDALLGLEQFEGVSAQEKIAWAKRVLSLPENAPKGVLWKTYMTRQCGVQFDATLEEIERGKQNIINEQYQTTTWVPTWLPLDHVIQNFEGDAQGMAAKYVYCGSPFVSRAEFERVAAEKYQQFLREAVTPMRKHNEQERDDFPEFLRWYGRQICLAYHLPENTSTDDAWEVYLRSWHVFGGAYSDRTRAQFEQFRQRDNATRIFKPNKDVSSELLLSAYSTLRDAVQFDSPELPLD